MNYEEAAKNNMNYEEPSLFKTLNFYVKKEKNN